MRKGLLRLGVICLLAVPGLRAAAACPGDCGGDGEVTVNELVLGVNIALGATAIEQCPSFDGDGSNDVTINELIAAVNAALNGCTNLIAGDYAGALDLDGQTGSIELSVAADGEATGTLVVEGASLLAHLARALSLPVGGFSVTLSGNVDAASGSFHVSGSFVDGNGQTVPVDISGTLPGPSGSVSISAQIGSDTFSGSLSAGAATPTPTPPGPTPTPIAGGCADGAFGVTFSNAAGTNADTSQLTLGKVTALDQPDPSTGTFIWVISGNVCTAVFGQVARGLAIQGIAMAGRIQPGTYQIGTAIPPFLSFSYVETKLTLDPSQNFTHYWSANGGTLVLEDAGGGALRFHATGVTMAKGLVFQGATGTFTLDISGTIDRVTHS